MGNGNSSGRLKLEESGHQILEGGSDEEIENFAIRNCQILFMRWKARFTSSNAGGASPRIVEKKRKMSDLNVPDEDEATDYVEFFFKENAEVDD